MANAFVIGPIGDKFAPLGSDARSRYEEALDVYEKVILPACSSNSVTAIRADQIAVSGEITEQVFRHLFEDELVIADVSGGNPNVMYELGLRHTRPHLTIQIGEYGQLPFDVQAVRTIMFSRSERGLIDARNALTHAISVGLAEGPDTLSVGRIWLSGAPQTLELETREEERQEDKEEIDADGFLDRINKAEDSFSTLTESMEKITATLERLGSVTEESGNEMAGLAGSKPAARMAVIGRMSKELQSIAEELSGETEEFSSAMNALDSGVGGALDYMEEFDVPLAEGPEGTLEFLNSLSSTAEETRSGFEDVGQFASLIERFGKMAKGFRKPSKQIARDLRTIIRAVGVMEEWDGRAQRIKEERYNVSSQASSSTGAASS